ncbi:glyoxylase-like metal-dependent hydrolase (beta-lactamase superfamily II) [Stackebrandtia endophytica]|uniref:Glyoxylase-like metal-dependent hydrolase (Beta-lactamase superfamily II) n=1 Tax=Stackebrandtia endophytica TaxID=1496996 RepID=A0A543B437_9ACTN|nr:MBL fold metallo-hydrolase [Stackebrandtia endophytica]TQL79582.1 glyoxylase-like metal-dependent hydrolase (beta-lactamase superfamily II) [Stackebrandtia endophytica]
MNSFPHVTPDGPAATLTIPGVDLTKFSVGGMDNNVYLLRCRDTGGQLLIDAADSPDRILANADAAALSTVVTTHRHGDHVGALKAVVEAGGARSLAHADDAAAIPVVTETVADGDTITVGGISLKVIHLVGHTPGGIALHLSNPDGPDHVFTGDSLFPGGVGRTTNPDDFTSLFNDVVTKLFDRFPDDTVIHPGHGDDTTLGSERPQLAQWRERGW